MNLLLLLFSCHFNNYKPPVDTSTYFVIRNVNIVDVSNSRIQAHKTVYIKDSLISGIYNEPGKQPAYPDHVVIIDGTGKYLMPGLWDMHFHIAWDNSNDSVLFKLLLSYGITGLRDMGGSLSLLNKLKQEIKENPENGPDIFGAGPIIDGNPPVQKDFSLPVDSLSDIVSLTDSLVRNGIDFFKVYSLLRQTELEKISSVSKKTQIPFAGHLSEYAEPETSIQLGQKSIEHLNRLDDIWQQDKKRLNGIARLMKKNHTWLCPTLITYSLKLHMIDPSIVHDELEKYINPSLKKEWLAARENRRKRLNTQEGFSKQETLFKEQKALLLFLYNKQIKLLAGSDFAGMPFVYPGLGLHQELEWMVESGIPVAEVIKSATLNPALYFGIENKNGTVDTGKYAHLILLEENPMLDIRNTQKIFRVFKKGKEVFSARQ